MKVVNGVAAVLAIAACVAAGGLHKFFGRRDWRLEVLAVSLCVLNAGLIIWQEWGARRKNANDPPPTPDSN